MTREELIRVLTVAGFSPRMKGEEVLVEVCTFCGNARWNLELNAEKGVYHAWCCRAGGRLDAWLTDVTGERHHVSVSPDRDAAVPVVRSQPAVVRSLPVAEVFSACRYLERRGLSADDAARYGLRVCVDDAHALAGRIMIPALDYWTGENLGWVGRSYTGARPKYLSTLPRAIVTGWRGPRRAPILIVEGHFDGIAVHQAGFSAAVLGGLGGPAALDWAARIAPAADIVVALDGSAARESDALRWRLVGVRGHPPTVLHLAPTEDPSTLGPARLQAAVAAALVASKESAAYLQEQANTSQ